MSVPFESSIVCPELIGRAAQLYALTRMIARAAGGHGQAALIAGEAGIGKSRLVAETKARARHQGFATLQGRCFEPNRILPYAPLLDLLRSHLGASPPEAILEALGPPTPYLRGVMRKT